MLTPKTPHYISFTRRPYFVQVLPTTKFGRRFVIPSVVPDTIATEVHYKVLYDTPEFTTRMNWLHFSGPTLKHDGDGPFTFPSMAGGAFGMEEFEIDPMTNGGSPPTASVIQYYTGEKYYRRRISI